jgi:hypothetical protein
VGAHRGGRDMLERRWVEKDAWMVCDVCVSGNVFLLVGCVRALLVRIGHCLARKCGGWQVPDHLEARQMYCILDSWAPVVHPDSGAA